VSACLRQGVDRALVLPARRTDRAWSLLGVLLTVEGLPGAGMLNMGRLQRSDVPV
jgi:hypothetical protein